MKRFSLPVLFLTALAFAGYSQTGGPVKDSAHLSNAGLLQQYQYENYQYEFPAKKRDVVMLGIHGGYSMLASDVRADHGYGFGLNIQKSFGHMFSLRLAGVYHQNYGLNDKANVGYAKNGALNGAHDPNADYVSAGRRPVYYNYNMEGIDVTLQGVFTFNNVNFYKKQPRWTFDLYLGGGALLYQTWVNALNGSNLYDYSNISAASNYAGTNQVRTDLKNLLDDDYETAADSNNLRARMGDYAVNPMLVVGGAINLRLAPKLMLSLTHRYGWTGDDLLDGQQWTEINTLTPEKDGHLYTSLGLSFGLGKGAEALSYTNPLVTPYNSLMTARSVTEQLGDTDMDGVMDLFDAEPNTPKGATVDTKGVTLDSDNDGVPDYKDREPFSCPGAQVDMNGIAIDSDMDGVPDCRDKELNSPAGALVDAKGIAITDIKSTANTCDIMTFNTIHFDVDRIYVKPEFYPELYKVAKHMEECPDAKLKVVGHTDVRASDEYNIQLSKRRAENVANHLTENFGIDPARIIIDYKGEAETVIPGC